MTTWSPTVSSAEEAGTANESYDDNRGIMKASVTLRCAYGDRHDLVKSICGARLPWPKGAAGVVPLAQTALIVPVITPGTATLDELIDYGEALVTINFSTEIVELASESIEPYAEFQTLDHRWFWWGPVAVGSSGVIPDPLREEEAPGRLNRGINYVRTDIDVSGPLSSSLTDLVGYVNSDVVNWSLLGFTSAAETLLYSPPQITYKIDSTNVIKFTVVKKFTYNPNGFNTYFRGKTGTWSPIYVAGTATPYKSYPPTAFGGVLL